MSHGTASEPDARGAAFECSPEPLLLLEGDDLVVRAANAAARSVFGDQAGQPVDRALAFLAGHPVVDRLRDVLATGVGVPRVECRVDGVDSSGAHAQRVLGVAATRCAAADGAVLGVVLHVEDLTADAAAVATAERRGARDGAERAADQQHQHELVTLQDSLLPDGLPIVSGVQVAARYALSQSPDTAGGDWFGAVPLPDGRLVLCVGDVVGRGVPAAVAMGKLATMFEERVRDTGDVGAALAALDRRARRVQEAHAATMCVAVVDTTSGSVSYCTAGHPPPMIVDAAGEATYLPPSGGGPLGSGLGHPFVEHLLAPQELLLLYTDGIVERPGTALTQSAAELAGAVSRAYGGAGARPGEQLADRVCRTPVDQLAGATGYCDDITVLAVQRVPPAAPLDLHLPADADALRRVRAELGDWLLGLGVSPLDEMALQHAVGELVTNAVEHAYPDPSSPEAHVGFRVELSHDGLVDVHVSDRGRWREPREHDGSRGRGLAMARGFTDELLLEHDENGTRARVRHRVLRSAVLLTGEGAEPAAHPGRPLAVEEETGRMRITGILDHRSSDELRRRLARAGRGGTRPLLVDLSEVDLLSSAGVQVLFEEVWASAHDAGLQLFAPTGSPAQHVLEQVRLPYLTRLSDTIGDLVDDPGAHDAE